MQQTMWPLSTAFFAVAILFPVASSATFLVARGSTSEGGSIYRRSNTTALRRGRRQTPEGGDDGDDHDTTHVSEDGIVAVAMATQSPCSCDCCQVQKMLPTSFVPQPNGQQITSACWKSQSDPLETGAESEEDICPSSCQLDNRNKILTSSKGAVDYNRFCNYNCQPVTDAVGTACTQFEKKWYQAAANDPSGNGKEVYPEPVMGLNSGYDVDEEGKGGGAGGPGGPGAAKRAAAGAAGAAGPGAPDAAAPAKAAAAAKLEKLNIVYDMRKLVAERLRSEAGANVAAGAAAAERVRINQWTTAKDAGTLKKLRVRYAAIAGKVEEGVAGVEADKNAADEAERKTKTALAAGRLFTADMVKEVRTLADAAIKTAVAPCAATAAQDRAEAKGLDKPEDWVKVVAARAANPYQKAVTDAVQRTSEYKNLADGLMNQAYGAQKQANSLIPHVNVLEAQGDVLGATIEKKQVTNLLAQAKSLQAQAAGYWNTAQKTRETIPKWQMAAAQAAAYSAWEYSNNAKAFR